MGGLQIENLLALMESASPFDRTRARREVVEYLTKNAASVAAELEDRGESVIRTSAGSFRLTKADLATA